MDRIRSTLNVVHSITVCGFDLTASRAAILALALLEIGARIVR
jgi:hypothetical protein